MKENQRSILKIVLQRYAGKLALVFLLSLFSVVLTILVFVMIEPFCKLLFRGEISNLSPISDFVLSLLEPFFDLSKSNLSIVVLVLLALLLYFLKNLFAYLSQWVMASLRSDLLYKLRNDLYRKILTLPIGYFQQQKRGDIVSRAVADTQEIQNTILSAVKTFLTEPITLIIFVSFLFYVNVRLSVYALLLFPVTFLIVGWVSSALKRDVRTSKKRLGSLLAHVEETISGIRVIKGLNAQSNAESTLHSLNQEFTRSQTLIYRRADLAAPLSEFLGVCIVMVILVIGGYMTFNMPQTFPAEVFITYIALFTQLIPPIKNISTAITNYKRGTAAMERISEIMDANDNIQEPEHPIELENFSQDLTFHNVSFSYGTNEVLNHIDFTVPKGKMIALVGPSGSGKSTVVDLIERFHDPMLGYISLDGIDIRRYCSNSYRSLFALVSQDVVIFNDTLYNNITMGCDVPESKVMEAIKVANLFDFVCSLPDGLQHHLSDRGLNLSGGQRQRLSIARAVLHDKPILLLDEATSAMDTQSEHLVQDAIERVMKDRTVVVVAHRLSTIQNADCILVLENGCIVERGTHQELIKQNGVYTNLVKIQQFN